MLPLDLLDTLSNLHLCSPLLHIKRLFEVFHTHIPEHLFVDLVLIKFLLWVINLELFVK